MVGGGGGAPFELRSSYYNTIYNNMGIWVLPAAPISLTSPTAEHRTAMGRRAWKRGRLAHNEHFKVEDSA